MSQFQRFLAKRLAISLVLTLVAVSVIFVVLRLLPGSPFEALVTAGNLSPSQVEEIRALYGLDQPMWKQYVNYMTSLLTFQFGYSILRSQPVWDVLEPRLINTLILLVPALVTTAILSSSLGMYVGWNRGSKLEKLSIITTTFLRSTPVFITGIFFIIVFAYNLELVPAFGMRSVTASPEGYIDTYLSLDFAHLQAVLEDLARTGLENGFDAVVFVNGHGGNISLIDAVVSTVGVDADAEILGTTYFQLATDEIERLRDSETGGMSHGGEFETSLVLALRPDLVGDERDAELWDEHYEWGGRDLLEGGPLSVYRSFDEYSESGAIGAPDLASAEKGERFYEIVTEELAAVLVAVHEHNR
mgnify:CR=1 FL=1